MESQCSDLAELGWSPFYQSQLDPDDPDALVPARVVAVHRGLIEVLGPDILGKTPWPAHDDADSGVTVGDWVLLDPATRRPVRRLDRRSVFERRAAGTGHRLQAIAANVDTLFVVSSCNRDFNPARLERYLALARAAEVMPLIVLTKADLADDPRRFATTAERSMAGVLVETVDARDRASLACLDPWCGRGQTVALLGSSGVGKSTLVNTLTGTERQATHDVRLDDARGRHTTSSRSLHRLPTGGWLLDTPGMRELGLAEVRAGLDEVFAEVVALAESCRFADCRHEAEPGCAVRAAIDAGRLDEERLQRFRKLVAEDARNSESLAERRARDRSFAKMVKGIMRDKRRLDGA